MNLKLLIGLIVLCLAACGTQPVKDDAPASDLDALKANVHTALKARTLSNGKVYCAELATTNDERDECVLDLEDTLFLSERDKVSAMKVLDLGIERIKLRLNPCGFWKSLFNRSKCHVPVDNH